METASHPRWWNRCVVNGADKRPGRLISSREDVFDLCREIGLTEQEISDLDAQSKQRAASHTTPER